MQVYCPRCAQAVSVGELPPGTLPCCPYCQTVFRLPETPSEPQVSPVAAIPTAPQSQPSALPTAPVAEPNVRFQQRVHRSRVSSPASSLGWSAIIGVFFLGLFVAIGWVAYSVFGVGQFNRNNAATGDFREVGAWTGSAPLKTARFRVDHSPWKIRWQTTAKPKSKTRQNFEVVVYDTNNNIIAQPVKHIGDGQDETLVQTPPGTYYLQVFAFDLDWRLIVESR